MWSARRLVISVVVGVSFMFPGLWKLANSIWCSAVNSSAWNS